MFGYIILRDIPKQVVQLDLLYFPIKGGFRGFCEVNSGPHYVSIEVDDEMHEGFWCWVKPGEAIIKVYDPENNIFKNDEENATLKRFYKEKTRARLQPANEQYQPIYSDNCRIEAVVIGLVRKL